MNFVENGVAHTTLVLEIDDANLHWHIVRLPSNSTKRCWAMEANTWTLFNAKAIINKHDTFASTYKVTKKKFPSTNNVEDEFWFCLDNIKHCVHDNKNKYV